MTSFTANLQVVLDPSLVAVPWPARSIQSNQNTTILTPTLYGQDDVAGIWIFNEGPNPMYYNYNATCDATNNFCGRLMPGGQLQVQTRDMLNAFSVGGTKIAYTYIIRNPSYGQPLN